MPFIETSMNESEHRHANFPFWKRKIKKVSLFAEQTQKLNMYVFFYQMDRICDGSHVLVGM